MSFNVFINISVAFHYPSSCYSYKVIFWKTMDVNASAQKTVTGKGHRMNDCEKNCLKD